MEKDSGLGSHLQTGSSSSNVPEVTIQEGSNRRFTLKLWRKHALKTELLDVALRKIFRWLASLKSSKLTGQGVSICIPGASSAPHTFAGFSNETVTNLWSMRTDQKALIRSASCRLLVGGGKA